MHAAAIQTFQPRAMAEGKSPAPAETCVVSWSGQRWQSKVVVRAAAEQDPSHRRDRVRGARCVDVALTRRLARKGISGQRRDSRHQIAGLKRPRYQSHPLARIETQSVGQSS
jgi:hypothetical protein